MRPLKTLACVLALTACAAAARADEHDRLTYLTFSGPVQLPGVTLAPGTYTFKLADIESNRHIVQVFTREDSKLITTLMTIPNERLEPVKDTFIMFGERPAGSPQAMKAWFYPGRSIGEEFIYPKSQALEIARANHEAVLSSEGEVNSTSAVGRVNENGNFDQDAAAQTASGSTAPAATAPATTAQATTAPSSTAQSANAQPAATAPAATAQSGRTSGQSATTQSTGTTAPATTASGAADTTARSQTASNAQSAPATTARRADAPVGTAGQANSSQTASGQSARALPRTASPLAMFELLSGLSVAAGFGLRQLRKRA